MLPALSDEGLCGRIDLRAELLCWTVSSLSLVVLRSARPMHRERRGDFKQVGIYLFFLVNILWVNLVGIPVGTQRDLDSDGRCFLSTFLCGS